MSEWEYNHKVTCSKCLYSVTHVRWVDELPFRYDITCELKHETDYGVPYAEEWDCKDYEEWTVWKSFKKRIKKLIHRRILNE